MRERKKNGINKIFSVLLACMMLLTSFPFTATSAKAATAKHPNAYTVAVTDGTAPIADATVTVKNSSNEWMLNLTANTAADGVAEFDTAAIDSALTEAGLTETMVSVTVSKAEYELYTQEVLIRSTDLLTNVDVVLKKLPAQKHLVNVILTGDATVKVNGMEQNSAVVNAGEEVPVEIIPVVGSYIKELVVDGTPVAVAKGEAYTGQIVVNADVEITATIAKEFTVTATANEGGTVTLDQQNTPSLKVDENTLVPISVTAEAGYQISSVFINGVEQVLSDYMQFNTQVKASEDKNIVVTFVKVYTVTVVCSANGQVTTTPQSEGGTVTVVSGTEVAIAAVPNENYRVAEVLVNGEKDLAVQGQNNEAYEKTLLADQNYEVQITFLPNRFDVRLTNENTPNGTVKIQNNLVNYGGSTRVELYPAEGYTVKNVIVNGVEITNPQEDAETGAPYFTIENITEQQNVTVEFTKTPSATFDDIVFDFSNAIRIDEKTNTYVIAKDSYVTFSTSKQGIWFANATNSKEEYGGRKIQSVNVNKDITIREIQLYYKSGWWPSWNKVNLNTPIHIVVDKTPASIAFTPDKPEYYNQTFGVNYTVTDPEDYSGLAKVEYFVTDTEIASNVCFDDVPESKKTQTGVKEIPANTNVYSDRVSIQVDDVHNNTDFVTLWVKATDRAGNVSYERTNNLVVNTVAPTVNVSIDGALHAEAEKGNYNQARTATLVFTDRASTFDQKAAEDCIQISAVNAQGNSVPVAKEKMIRWKHSNNQHIATVTFDVDANYTWSVGAYTNKAGLSSDAQATKQNTIGEMPYEFTVDTTAPEKLEMRLDGSLWTKLVRTLTFGLFKNYEVKAVATGEDATTKIKSILYYKSNADEALTYDALEALYNDVNTKSAFQEQPITVRADESFTIYARVTNTAGQTAYVSTDGIIFDKTKSAIQITMPKLENQCAYNKDVSVEIAVDEAVNGAQTYSGIQTVEYWVEKEGVETQKATLYSFNYERDNQPDSNSGTLTVIDWNSKTQENTEPEIKKNASLQKKDLTTKWNGTVVVDAQANNSDDVQLFVKVTDNAGNTVQSAPQKLSVNIDRPTAKIEFNDAYNFVSESGQAYYAQTRTATIQLTDRMSAFDSDKATDGISYSAVDAKGNPVSLVTGKDVIISPWTSEGNTHTATVTFVKDGNYTWSFQYTNKAGNILKTCTTEEKEYPFSFTVDQTNPFGTIQVNENVWDKLLEVLTFGLYSNVDATVKATAEDATSPVKKEYYKTSDTRQKTSEELDKIKTWTPYDDSKGLTVPANEQFVIYLKITDYAGNTTYMNSDGFIVDNMASDITLTLPAANGYYTEEQNQNGQYGIYNNSVAVDIDVQDKAPSSGIQNVKYWVQADGKTTQEATLYDFDYARNAGNNSNGGTLTVVDWDSAAQQNLTPVITTNAVPAPEDLKTQWKGTVVLDKNLNNSSDTVLYVQTKDNAGETTIKQITLDIDITAPKVQVSFDNNQDNNGNGYFNAGREATIVITERSNHFNKAKATESILVEAVDAKGNPVENAYKLSDWTTVENKNNPDLDTHTATLTFAKDANYRWSIQYVDEADNPQEKTNVGNSVAPFEFTVDTQKPVGTIQAVSSEGRKESWQTLTSKDSLSFGFWAKGDITVSATAEDATCADIASLEYYKVSAKDATEALTAAQLDAVSAWKPYEELTFTEDEQFVVYLKITDFAGWYTYISTDGLIVDHEAPIEETIAPQITITPEQPVNGIYNQDVKVDVKVVDPVMADSYSGLKKISYKVLNMGQETQAETLYEFDNAHPSQSDLLQVFTQTITVDSAKNNSNDVVIKIFAEDNAGNTSAKEIVVKIDTTKPTVDVIYDNNTPVTESFFKADRTATIVVTERNFNPEDVQLTITNTDGVIPQLGTWVKTEGTGNGDDTKWTNALTFDSDGDYTFQMTYADLAGNVCDGVNYGNSVVPTAFTIDKTIPVVEVSYDNNEALNGNYYKAARTATVVVTEHNFDTNRVDFRLTATDDGNAAPLPTVSGWTTEGDKHTATIFYGNDAKYTFDIHVSDMADNLAEDYAEETFFVDQTAPTLEITGVADHSANKGDVMPVVSYMDTNYDENQMVLSLTGANRKAVQLDGAYADQHNGRVFTFNNFAKEKEIDDIYTLTASLTDKAGNETSKTITFSVNRFGSTYALSDATTKLNNTYVQNPEDVVFTETNANELKNIKITLFKNNNTIELVEGKDYEISVTGGNGQWYHYTYTVFKENFVDDAVYRLTIHTEDTAGNVAENTLDTKNMEIRFGVDNTKPTLTVTNLESNTTYALDNLIIAMNAKDNLLLQTVTVYLDDYNKPYKTWTAEEISAILSSNGEFNFEIPGDSTSSHKVKIVCVDAAGNEYIEEIDDFFVTTDLWIRFYTNKPLFFGSIAGVVLLSCLIIFLIVRKKKEKDQENK